MSDRTLKILMIDDDEQILFALRAVFQFQGWESVSAKDVPSGLELFRSEHPDLVLIDGNRQKDFGLPVKTVVKGDSLSANIAAASVLAKVTRDDFMVRQAEQFPEYGFEIHKGYGTKAHYAALEQYGACPIHRKTFLKKFYEQK